MAELTLGDIWPHLPEEERREMEREFEESQQAARDLDHHDQPWRAWWQVDKTDRGVVTRVYHNMYSARDGQMVLWGYQRTLNDEGAPVVKIMKETWLPLDHQEIVGAWEVPADDAKLGEFIAYFIGVREVKQVMRRLHGCGES